MLGRHCLASGDAVSILLGLYEGAMESQNIGGSKIEPRNLKAPQTNDRNVNMNFDTPKEEYRIFTS